MSFDLAVWQTEQALSTKEALELYMKLAAQDWIPLEQSSNIEAFYIELCSRYPEIDTLPEEELDSCPWSCRHNRSGLHVIMSMNFGEELERAAQFITDLAVKYDLVCFDPQGPNVYLPPSLKRKRPRFRFW